MKRNGSSFYNIANLKTDGLILRNILKGALIIPSKITGTLLWSANSLGCCKLLNYISIRLSISSTRPLIRESNTKKIADQSENQLRNSLSNDIYQKPRNRMRSTSSSKHVISSLAMIKWAKRAMSSFSPNSLWHPKKLWKSTPTTKSRSKWLKQAYLANKNLSLPPPTSKETAMILFNAIIFHKSLDPNRKFLKT